MYYTVIKNDYYSISDKTTSNISQKFYDFEGRQVLL